MSDVFELPMIDHGHNDFRLMNRDETEYAHIAINAYDANQECIAEFEIKVLQQEAMINFQALQHNDQVDLGIKREKEIIRLNRKLEEKDNEK